MHPPDHAIGIVVADHKPLTRRLVADLLDRAGGFAIIAEAGDTTTALAACAAKPNPHVLLLRSDLPGYNAFAALRSLRLQDIETAAAVIFPTPLDQQLDDAIACGATGLFSHEDGPEELVGGLRHLVKEGTHHSASIRERLHSPRSEYSEGATPGSPLATLTTREREILELIAEGLTQRQIADRFGLAPKTIDNHAGKLMTKLGIHNRVRLTRYAIREGLVSVDEPSPARSSPPIPPIGPGR